MASNDYDIVNLALVRIGANRITSLADGSRNANEANAIYELVRDEVLRSHPWNFAIRVADLISHAENELTITAATQAKPVVITYTGDDPSNGDEYLIEDVVGMTELNDNTYNLHGIDTSANTAKLRNLDGTNLDGTAFSAYVSGGTATEDYGHDDDQYSYVYELPLDSLRILQMNDDPNIDFEIQEGYLNTNETHAEVRYIKQEDDVTKYDATFVDAFAWRLAQELAVIITGSIKKQSNAAQQYHALMHQRAMALDAREGHTPKPTHNRYESARR